MSVVHKSPPIGFGIMPCCGRTPFEVPRTDRLTLDARLVTCTEASPAHDANETLKRHPDVTQ